ncbi:MAG: Usg family protein [Candidatus Kaiserbacteria bacterium]|nr:Usg family protein [Candidatus Kaiserbacteria bacterium]
MTVSADFRKQVEGFGLTTAQIWYTKPGYPWLINSNWLLWQQYDLAPKFPKLLDYLNFWQTNLDGKPVIVRVMHSHLIKATEIKTIDGEFRLN